MNGIRNLTTTDNRNPVPAIQNSQRGIQNPRLSWITPRASCCWCLINNVYHARTWAIRDSRVSCIKPWVLTAQRRKYDLNGIPYWVHWMRKGLTAQHERLIPIIWSNICDCNTGLWSIIAGNVLIRLQSKIEEAKFNDVPAGNCDIPGTSTVLREVTWKIWSWKESTKPIKMIARGTSCNKRK